MGKEDTTINSINAIIGMTWDNTSLQNGLSKFLDFVQYFNLFSPPCPATTCLTILQLIELNLYLALQRCHILGYHIPDTSIDHTSRSNSNWVSTLSSTRFTNLIGHINWNLVSSSENICKENRLLWVIAKQNVNIILRHIGNCTDTATLSNFFAPSLIGN